jgi:hypothetical protein
VKPATLGTPERDLGWAEIRPLAENLIEELERQAKKIQALEKGRQPAAPLASPGLAEARRLLSRLSLRTGDAVTLERQRVLHRAADETYFRLVFSPGEGVLDGAATVVDGTTYVFPFEDYPAAAIAMRRKNVKLRELWPRTRVRMNLFYTSPVGSTNTFTVGFRLRQVGTGMSLATPFLVANPTANVPGPAVANDVLFATLTTTAAMLPTPEVVSLTFTRAAPDANANALRVILVEFVLQEVA